MVARCREELGRLDVVVNNAGTTHFVKHTELEEMTEDKWDNILSVNLKGPFFVSRAAIPVMRAGGGGSIVNVAAVAGVAGSGSSMATRAGAASTCPGTSSSRCATSRSPSRKMSA